MSEKSNPKVTVFLSSSELLSPVMFNEVRRLGETIAEQNWDLVYGGTHQGAMGILANAFLGKTQTGRLVGVVPGQYVKDWAHPQLHRLIQVDSLAERKKVLIEEADVLIASPGGIGTLDEVTDFLALLQLGQTDKSLVFFNPFNYWDPFLDCLRVFEEQSTIPAGFRDQLQVLEDLQAMVGYIESLRRGPS